MDNGQATSLSPQQIQDLWTMFAGIWVFIAAFVLVTRALAIWFFWRIFEKAGYNGAIALINLVGGLGTVASVLILAFGTWPNSQPQQGTIIGPSPAAAG